MKAVKVFSIAGWTVDRRTGSHIIMVKEGEEVILSIPDHRVVKRGTLRSIIKDSGMTVKEFNKRLSKKKSP